MSAEAQRGRVGGLMVVAGLVASAGYALAAAVTTPFTWAAELMTAIPIAVVGVSAVVFWPAHPDRDVALNGIGLVRPRHPYLGWVVLLSVVVAWELAEYVWRGSRDAHPTLSSMADGFDAHDLGKAVAFLAWLWLGAAIVRAGVPVGAGIRVPRARPS